MQKIITIFCKVLLTLILVMPILGALRIFPEPTAAMYTNTQAYTFIKILMDTGYVIYINAAIFIASIVLLWMNRTALAALLILPITVNIVAFHAFMDGGLLTGGAILGNMLLLLNAYFLWTGRASYKVLLEKN